MVENSNKKMVFLASIPRSGSTLLTSLLNQRSDTYASPTSNLCDTMGAAFVSWSENVSTKTSGATQADIDRVLKAMMDARYDTDKTVFDKWRGWPEPHVIKTMDRICDVKIIATVRPIAESLASFIRVAKPKSAEDFIKNDLLAKLVFKSYAALKAGYEAYPNKFLFIEYDDLVGSTQKQMDRIYDFVGLPKFEHDLNNIKKSEERDLANGIDSLHELRPTVSRLQYSPKDVLGETLFNYYQGGEFWNDKPEPVRKIDDLDLQLAASIQGNFEEAESISKRLLKERPNCNRVAFNAGWFSLKNGKLQEGHKLLDRGRKEGVFGNQFCSNRPKWNGETGVTVILNLEGGLGDQIHGFRFAHDIQNKGNKVIVACSSDLAPIFADQFTTVQHEAACGVFHDYWYPSMSAIIPLGYECKDIKGTPYIKRTAKTIPGRIGLRWSGNPNFEHEQHRLFPSRLMFDAVKGYDSVSLQRDSGTKLKPLSTKQADVHDWEATRKSISECELVITSCTSIAHMSASMGVETWVVVPVLPYYLWAFPGDKSPYYDSVTLFRQEKYGDWEAPFAAIRSELEKRNLKNK